MYACVQWLGVQIVESLRDHMKSHLHMKTSTHTKTHGRTLKTGRRESPDNKLNRKRPKGPGQHGKYHSMLFLYDSASAICRRLAVPIGSRMNSSSSALRAAGRRASRAASAAISMRPTTISATRPVAIRLTALSAILKSE